VELDEDQQSRAALGRAPVLTGDIAKRLTLSTGVAAFFVVGYFGVARGIDPVSAWEVGCALDRRIPFLAGSVWVYLSVFPASLLPLFLVRCPDLFRRTLLAYAIAIAVSLIAFVAIPITSIGLRVDPGTLEVNRLSPWVVALLYRIDPPVNLYPSLHLSIAMLAALSAWKARHGYGAAAFVGVALIAVSICTVKQHFVVDGLGGAALALAVHAVVLRTYAPRFGIDPAYGWRGPAAFACLMIAVYAGIYAGFRISPSRCMNRTRWAIVSFSGGSGREALDRLRAVR
jgi:membrane-associated phospholipid phosphatase